MHVKVEIATAAEGDRPELSARIGGGEFPIAAYSVEPATEGGRAMVSLLVPADHVHIGAPKPAAAGQGKPLVTWGATGVPDPREGLPGWTPETIGTAVARNAAVRLA